MIESMDAGSLYRVVPGQEPLRFLLHSAQFRGAGKKVRFKYKLEGFDSDWVDGGTRARCLLYKSAAGPLSVPA